MFSQVNNYIVAESNDRIHEPFSLCALPESSTYADVVYCFEMIDQAKVLIIDNRLPSDGSINYSTALQIMFAMLRRKAIILFETPEFAKDVSRFIKEVIMNRMNKLLICPLPYLEPWEIDSFIASASSEEVNYVITKHDATLMKSHLRAYFRRLL
jgi:hypothetical protein